MGTVGSCNFKQLFSPKKQTLKRNPKLQKKLGSQ